MSTQFAKLFERDNLQVVVMLDTDEDGNPEVSFRFKPEGLGVCKLGINFGEDNWEGAEIAFDYIDEDKAFEAIKDALEMTEGLGEY